MNKVGFRIKIFGTSIIILMTLIVLIHSFSATSSYFTSNIGSLPQGFLVCGEDNGTLWNENKTTEEIITIGKKEDEVYSSVQSKIYGTVFTPSKNSKVPLSKTIEDVLVPLENATVAIMYIEDESSSIFNVENKTNDKIWKAILTDENGYYSFDLLAPGLYEIKASKQGYLESKKNINLDKNQNIILNFTLTKTSNQNVLPSENLTKIIEATKTGHVGGEITVWQKEYKTFDHEILIYDSVNISKLDIEKGILSFTVSGNESSTGKTITLNIDLNVFNSDKEIIVKYDKQSIEMADDISDALNPNDDGSNPEYLIAKGSSGMQILISIPHFSEHEITIFSLTEGSLETLGGITAIVFYIATCLAASVFFAGVIFLRRKT